MPHLKINHDLINNEAKEKLIRLCPFEAIGEVNGKLEIGAGCRMCSVCVKKGPSGAIELIKDGADSKKADKSEWRGTCVYAEMNGDTVHPVGYELLGKAISLGASPIYALLIGHGLDEAADKLLSYGADKVYVYDDGLYADFRIDTYAAAFEDFINRVKPSSIFVGATNTGRSLAPRVAARFGTGLTADCTMLEMREGTELVQIRPAFGGNIMAQIITPDNRPQFCTVRYKIFSAVTPREPAGEIIKMKASPVESVYEVLNTCRKPSEVDIAEADVIVAAGRGVKSAKDLAMINELATELDAMTASTRPLIEVGWFDPKRQIGLSGRTVKPKLIITCGISGSVQFSAGMKGADCIIAINNDPEASIFNIAHYGLVGDIYEIVPQLTEMIKKSRRT